MADIEGTLNANQPSGFDWKANTPGAKELLRALLRGGLGDLTGDGVVSAADLAKLKGAWGPVAEQPIEQGWTDPPPVTDEPPPETATSLKPIAAFDIVPYQSIVRGDAVRVLAFSKAGIWGVLFRYGCDSQLVRSGGSPEFIDPVPDGLDVVSAEVIGNDGGRNLLSVPVNDESKLTIIRGETIESSGPGDYKYRLEAGKTYWFDQCLLQGCGQNVKQSHPVKRVDGATVHWTNCIASDIGDPVFGAASLVCYCDAFRIGEDFAQNSQYVFCCSVHDQDPKATGAHADVFQIHSYSPDEVIWYNMIGTNLRGQSIQVFNANSSQQIKRMAIVGCKFIFNPPVVSKDGRPRGLILQGVDHGVFDFEMDNPGGPSPWVIFGNGKNPDGTSRPSYFPNCSVNVNVNGGTLQWAAAGTKPW